MIDEPFEWIFHKLSDKDVERLREIIKIASKLKWINPTSISKVPVSYPLMQLSEVEKCMLAMTDDIELARMRKWYEDEVNKEIKNEITSVESDLK